MNFLTWAKVGYSAELSADDVRLINVVFLPSFGNEVKQSYYMTFTLPELIQADLFFKTDGGNSKESQHRTASFLAVK
ncbi:MAG: hypothetical protein RIC35_04600 [Marinoscillum sp.]